MSGGVRWRKCHWILRTYTYYITFTVRVRRYVLLQGIANTDSVNKDE